MSPMAQALWSLYRNQKAKGLRAAMRQTLQKMERAGFNDAAWFNAMGELAMEEGNPTLALRFFQQACQKSDATEYRLNQGHAHFAVGDYSQAEKQYAAVLESTPDDAHALANRANCMVKMERFDEAWALCEQGLGHTLARAAFWNMQGQIAFLRGDLEQALGLFQRAYQDAPDYTDALFNQANVEFRLGMTEKAMSHFELCTRKDENFESAFFNLAMLQLENGRVGEAFTSAHKALNLKPDSVETLHLLARIHYANGDMKLAREAFRKALRRKEDHIPSLLGLARVLTQENQIDDATALVKRILGMPQVTAEDRKAFLSLLLDLGQYHLVLMHCERIPEDESESFALLHTAALWKSGKLKEAIQRLEKVLLIQTDSIPALTLLGMMLREQGAPQLAESRLRRALELAPGTPRIASELAMAFLAQDKAEDAVAVMKEALVHQPGHPDLLYNLACAQSRSGNLDDALSTLQFALENGFSDLERLGHDSDMQSLRQLRAFSALIGEPG